MAREKDEPKIATGSRELDEAEAKRLREREEKGLEPEQHPGPRQNEGIEEGSLYATQEEADEASPTPKEVTRKDVDREAAQVPRHAPSRHDK